MRIMLLESKLASAWRESLPAGPTHDSDRAKGLCSPYSQTSPREETPTACGKWETRSKREERWHQSVDQDNRGNLFTISKAQEPGVHTDPFWSWALRKFRMRRMYFSWLIPSRLNFLKMFSLCMNFICKATFKLWKKACTSERVLNVSYFASIWGNQELGSSLHKNMMFNLPLLVGSTYLHENGLQSIWGWCDL